MLSSEALPEIALRATAVARRFRIFLVVGAIGLAINQALLYLLVAEAGLRVAGASPFAIVGSMIVTFLLNEHW
ncbi:MAG: GtrA family protein, partial [Thermomicrobiales bacterium]|nr:GtrA family protein [Thermomicrobiales bacterium]